MVKYGQIVNLVNQSANHNQIVKQLQSKQSTKQNSENAQPINLVNSVK